MCQTAALLRWALKCKAGAKTRNGRESAEGAMRRQAMPRGAEVEDSRAEIRVSMALEGNGTHGRGREPD